MPEILFPYNAVELSTEVVRIPNTYGMLNELNLFPAEGMSSRIVEIDYTNGVIVVLAADVPGARGQTLERDTGEKIFVEIPHFPMMDSIGPRDLQGLLEVLNGQRVNRTFDRELARHLQKIRLSHGVTREYIRIGALKGLVRDGKGRTLLDSFSKFGITKKVVYFNLASATQSIIDKCQELLDYYADNIRGETMSGVEVLVSQEFFSNLIQHPQIQKYWLQTQAAQALATIPRGKYGRQFEFQGILFQEYRGFMPIRQANGAISSVRTIDAGKGHAYPTGTSDTFKTFDGPIHHVDHVNVTPESEIFISPKVLDHGEGVELKSQSNALAIAKRPELLVEVDMGAGS